MCAISLCHSQPSGRPASCRQPLYTRNRQPIDEGSEVNSITRQTADRPPGTISTLPPLADSPKCYMTHRWTERDSNPQSPSTVSSVRQLLPVVSGASASPIPFAVLRCSGSTKVAEPGSVPDRSLARYGLAGVSGTTAGTPSGLMLKARKVNGSLPGLPHWWTRPKGS
jgi:hypothetical protein